LLVGIAGLIFNRCASATKQKRVRDMQSLSLSLSDTKPVRPSLLEINPVNELIKKLILFPLSHWQFSSDLGNDLTA